MTSLKPVSNRTIDIESKTKLYQAKLKDGFPLKEFFKAGNGMKTILQNVGRLIDFKGVFFVINRKNKPMILGESEQVLAEVQKLARGVRVKDQQVLEKLGGLYGFKTALAGQEYLKSMRVNWIEVVNKVDRIALKRALEPTAYFVLK